MELTIYDVIKKPIISDKAYKLNKALKQLMLEVHPKANKPLIKKAFEKLFDVKIETVRTAIKKYSPARGFGKRYNAQPSIVKKKIAYITLAEGYSLNFFEQMGAPIAEEAQKEE